MKNQLSSIINSFSSDDNVGFGIGQYRNESELEDGFENMEPISEDRGLALGVISSLTIGNCFDMFEANY